MDRPDNEPRVDEHEHEHVDDSRTIEDLDIPDDLKKELLRELEGLKEGDRPAR